VQILLTNDDGIHAPGLAALEQELHRLGDVTVVAPLTEGHAITYLTPLMARKVFDHDRQRGWAVEGTPADCVKLAVGELCRPRPELIISGVNGGQNAGINVLHSGTVAAAIEGAFFGITSIAVSLEYDDNPRFEETAQIAAQIIQQILEQKGPEPQLYNLNIPTAALDSPPEVRVVPMGTTPWSEGFEQRLDPRGQTYYWVNGTQPAALAGIETDVSALADGKITLTPLDFDMTHRTAIQSMQSWQLGPTTANAN